MTKVIDMKTAPKGWKTDPNYVYIGRPSKWGNPYTVSGYGREGCIKKFTEGMSAELKQSVGELKDKILVCYCKPFACHGDVLAKLADEIR